MKDRTVHRFSRSKFIRFGLLTLCSIPAAAMCSRVSARDESTVKASRLKTLSKGFNLDHWLERWQTSGYGDGHYTEPTLQKYKSLGLTYTRLPCVLSGFMDDNNPSVLKNDSLAALDAIIKMHAKMGLGIVLSPFNHPDELYSDPALQSEFVAFFKAFATHLSHTDPETVFFEVMNEPHADRPEVWNAIQLKLIAAIRSVAPNHTIIATPNLQVSPGVWSAVGGFVKTQVVPDKNIVYSFHFYDPFVFSHQGAVWGWNASKYMKGIPYPSTPAVVAPLLNTIQDAEAKSAVEGYGKENWNRSKIESELAPVFEWAKTHRVPLICDEFGAYPLVAPKDSRQRYLKDVRETLESHRIGWAEWFALDIHDNEIMQALGLNTSTALVSSH